MRALDGLEGGFEEELVVPVFLAGGAEGLFDFFERGIWREAEDFKGVKIVAVVDENGSRCRLRMRSSLDRSRDLARGKALFPKKENHR